ncbi:MAG: hypothetical protein HOC23_18990 [Halieaceae bacterium]|jgi:hypothetical protein|nr:hypothetical protein [Halieaceae bacterium]
MNKLVALTMGLVMAGATLPAFASSSDNEYLGQCKAGLKAIYGEDTRLKLKSIKRSRAGNQFRIKAIPAQSSSLLVTCWVDDQGKTNLVDKNGVAIRSSENKIENQVSLNN